MFLWIGCKLPEEFESEIRQHCMAANQQIGLNTLAFQLPQHISLKISFQTECVDDVLNTLVAYLVQQTPFSVELDHIEQVGNILWIPVEESIHLKRMHAELDSLLEQRFSIGQHEFDKCFLFHSTLFIDSNEEKIAQMAGMLATYSLPRKLPVDTFLLGISETGKPGSYHIVHQIQVQP